MHEKYFAINLENLAILQALNQVARWLGIMVTCNVWPCKV